MKYQGVVSQVPLFFDKRHQVTFATEVCLVEPNTSDKFECAVEQPPAEPPPGDPRPAEPARLGLAGARMSRLPTRSRRAAFDEISARDRAMDILLQQLVNSLSVASVIILIGIGITLIFGLTGIINFAHGEFLMVGGMRRPGSLVSQRQQLRRRAARCVVLGVGALGFVARARALPLHARPADERLHHLARPDRRAPARRHPLLELLPEEHSGAARPRLGDRRRPDHRYARRRGADHGRRGRDHLLRHFAQPLRPGASGERRRPETAALMGIPVRRYVTGVFIYGSVIAGLGGALMIALFPITPFIGSVVVMLRLRRGADWRARQRHRRRGAGLVLGWSTGSARGYGTPEWTEPIPSAYDPDPSSRPQGLLGRHRAGPIE